MGTPQCLRNLLRREYAMDSIERSHRNSAQRGSAPAFAPHDVSAPLDHHEVARLGVRSKRDLIGHAARWHEDSRFLAQDVGDDRLQLVHRRIVCVHVVSNNGLGHHLSHGVRRLRDGIAA